MSTARCLVIGDIHGCAAELSALLDYLAPSSADTFVFLGDYIDRGPDSKQVIERLLGLRSRIEQCVFLKGNHEDMFLAYAGQRGRHGEAFLYNGGEATLESYGLVGCSGAELWARLPDEHRLFFESLQLYYRVGSFLCVHAGFSPSRPWTDQDEEDLLWIRHEWIRATHNYGLTVLFGHTPMRVPFIHWPYKIGLDTGLVYGNALTCFEIPSLRFWQIRRGERVAYEWYPPTPLRFQ